ncbi:MAG: inositol monophosphatase [Acidobacteria bacterium]|jgi:myo-inositol-1(or 4)-monophosphatase|nr:inositol monophosphatase [Acidobacteriota bacterium]
MHLDPLLRATAVDVALRAGAIQKSHFGGTFRVDKKGEIDLVTEVDLAAERMIREVIEARFPGHAVLGEELSGDALREPQPGYCWVCDPLDGTTNFAHGLPIFCTSIGLEVDGQAVIGVVYDPMRDELFVAERGKGATLNGAPMRVSAKREVIDSLLCTGFPYDIHRSSEPILQRFGDFIRHSRAVRRLGSAALDLCYTAAGRLDGFWEASLKPWDTCAGALIVSEAGGRVTNFENQPFQSRMRQLVASNGAIHDEMLRIVSLSGEQRPLEATS